MKKSAEEGPPGVRNVCENCVNYTEGEEYGLGPRTGFCEHWKRPVKATGSCEYFVARKRTVTGGGDYIPDGDMDEDMVVELSDVEPDLLDINTKPPFQ